MQYTKGPHAYTFQCQHGPQECLGNTVHACAAQHVSSAPVLLEYVKCMISNNYDPLAVGKRCAEENGVDWEPVRACAEGREGQDLLAAAGDKTDALKPKVSFIPTITIDGSQGGQKGILKDFTLELCKRISVRTSHFADFISNNVPRYIFLQGEKPAACQDIL